MNIKLLRRIQKQILKEPRQFQMGSYYARRLPGVELIPNCGTACCVAGWAVSLTMTCTPAEAARKSPKPLHPRAAVTLGLTSEEASRLFYMDGWPMNFRILAAEGTLEFAANAVARIDHFIKTKGAE